MTAQQPEVPAPGQPEAGPSDAPLVPPSGSTQPLPTTPPAGPAQPPSAGPVATGQSHPQYPAYPAHPPPVPQGSWSGPPPTAWGAPTTEPDAARALRSARTALGWAIGAAVVSVVALVVTMVTLVGGSGVLEDDYYYETLRGQVVGISDGSRLGGDRLEYAIGGLLDDYEVDHDVQCPDTEDVGVSSVVVCTGEVDGYEWTGVVVFEDEAGSFAVVEL